RSFDSPASRKALVTGRWPNVRHGQRCTWTRRVFTWLYGQISPGTHAFGTNRSHCYRDTYAFCLRRLPTAEDAQDAVAEVSATARRSVDRLPLPPEDRLWVF